LPENTKAETKPERHKETLSESIGSIASVLVCGLFIITFVVQAFEIPTGSMEDTLLVGDHVFVDRIGPTAKAGYLGPLIPYRKIKRNDIIVFLHPATPGMYVVKRIVGTPGDKLHLEHGKLFVNGVAQNEPYLNPNHIEEEYRDNFPRFGASSQPEITQAYPWWPMQLQGSIQNGDLVVPPDSYFGMGDNRSNSLDSRFWGFIPKENVVGRPLFIYWSFETPRDQYEHGSWFERAKFMGYILLHFFGETRWNRAFQFVR
jgi:signal peptidase I